MENETMNQNTETQATEVQTTPETQPEQQDDRSEIERLKADLEAERAARKADQAAMQKNKAALDKALKDVGRLTKENREKMTDAEREAARQQEEAEKLQEELNDLRLYRRKNDAKERYLLQGMTPELAVEAAEAEVAGDMDKLADIQHQHTEALLKAKEAEWKLSRPSVNVGSGPVPMTKEEIMAMDDRVKQLEAIAMNLDLFKN